MTKVLVTGAGGFIGGHLCRHLKKLGYWVRAVDIRTHPYATVPCDEGWWMHDLRVWERACQAVAGCDWVFGLAADMGGLGFIMNPLNDFDILKNNLLINVNTLTAAARYGVERYLFSSSACVYPRYRQEQPDAAPLKEEEAYPADCDNEYGWEKLLTERMCQAVGRVTDTKTRIVRFHNVYGPNGSWNDGREKAPAALCRKIAHAKMLGRNDIEIWGDGEQTRSFMYIEDCLDGLLRLMNGDFDEPLNLGRDRMVSINELADIIANIAGIEIIKEYDLTKPQGVRGRNSDNSLCKKMLGWAPGTPLETGLVPTYEWVEDQTRKWLTYYSSSQN